MNDEKSLIKLKRLHAESEGIRRRLRISPPNPIVFRCPINPVDDEEVVVEGNYPIDFLSLRETTFATERSAIEAAERLINHAT